MYLIRERIKTNTKQMKQLLTITALLIGLNLSAQTNKVNNYQNDSITYTQPKDTIILMVQHQQPTGDEVARTLGIVLVTTIIISTIAFMIPFMIAP
jgi:hypothetical protein